MTSISRRTLLKSAAGLGLAAGLGPARGRADEREAMEKPIPVSGEMLPVIGLGTAYTFDVARGAATDELAPLLQAFFAQNGALIDSSPMYGEAERVTGDLLRRLDNTQRLFAATKVWTDGKQQGIAQMERSMALMGVRKFDLMQIHNLRDWRVHLETLRDWRERGRIRYLGITTSHGRFHDELAALLDTEQWDFVQLTYNIANRAVENRLLPLARERNIAVLANRPYAGGGLFRAVKGRALPAWVAEFDCTSWGQFYLKYVVSHPAVTCAIPATAKLEHLLDNMSAGFGRLPDATMRKRMEDYFAAL